MAQTIVGRATIIVDADARPADATIKKAAKDTESSLTSALATAGKYGAVALAGLAGAGALVGVKTAASMEQASIAFTTMLGSAQKSDAFLKQLAAFAAKTPFEFPELQTAASSLISAGINASKVIPIMTTLGNVTSGMGTGSEGIRRATIALQQMSAAGRITGEDLNQLRDAGIPVFDLLAAATGKSKAAIAELAQQGKLGKKELDAMMKALETGAGLERFSGLMDKQSQSLAGLWSTLKDTIQMGLAKSVEPLIPMLKSVIGFTSDFAGKALPWLSQALVNIGTAIAQFITSPAVKEWGARLLAGAQVLAAFIMSTVLPALAAMGRAVVAVVKFFVEHQNAAIALGIVVGGVLTAITAAWVAQGTVAAINAAKAVLAWFSTANAATTAATIQSKSTAQIVAGWVLHAAAALKSGMQTVAIWGLYAVEAAKAAVASVAAHLKIVAGWVLMGAQSLLAAAKVAAAWLIAMGPIAIVIAAVVGLVALIIVNWDKIKAVIAAGWEWVRANTVMVWNAITSWVAGIWNTIRNWAVSVFTSIANFLSATWNTIRATAVAIWTGIWTWFGTLWNGIRATFSAALSFITTLVSQAFNTARSIITTIWTGIQTALSNGWNWISAHVFSPLRSGIQFVVDAFSNARAAIGRVWDGLTSVISTPIQNALRWVQQNLIDRFNGLMSNLGIGLRIPTIWTAPKGYAEGGYTGGGSPKKAAGIVHGREWVLNAKSTAALMRDYGTGFLNALNGYAGGGWVAPVIGYKPAFPWGRYPSGGVHKALDYAVPTGTPVYAPDDGRIVKAGWDTTGYGISAFINHNNGLFSVLGHLQRVLVNVGQFVTAGQRIGFSDNTGRSSGPHLHWGVMSGGIYGPGVNPGGVAAGGGLDLGKVVADLLRSGIAGIAAGTDWLGRNLGPMGALVGGIGKRMLTYLGEKALMLLGFGEGGGRGVRFDSGGWLKPGWNPPSYNGTGRPEPVGWGQAGVTVYMNVSVDDLAKMSQLGDFLDMISSARATSRGTQRSGRVSA